MTYWNLFIVGAGQAAQQTSAHGESSTTMLRCLCAGCGNNSRNEEESEAESEQCDTDNELRDDTDSSVDGV